MGEYCPPYNDSSGKLHSGFVCPLKLKLYSKNDYYCCGNQTYRNCCSEYGSSIFVQAISYSDLKWLEYWPYLFILFVCILVLSVSPFLKPNRISVVQAR